MDWRQQNAAGSTLVKSDKRSRTSRVQKSKKIPCSCSRRNIARKRISNCRHIAKAISRYNTFARFILNYVCRCVLHASKTSWYENCSSPREKGPRCNQVHCRTHRIATLPTMILRQIYSAAVVFIYFLRLGLAKQPHVIGSDAILPHDPRQDHERYVTWHPIDGQEVDLNPPRFRWPYDMSNIRIEGSVAAVTKWDFQIASTPFFQRPIFAIRGVAYNFFNAVPSLEGDGPFYWRVRGRRFVAMVEGA